MRLLSTKLKRPLSLSLSLCSSEGEKCELNDPEKKYKKKKEKRYGREEKKRKKLVFELST